MKTKPPPDRRKFASIRDRMEYLYHKLLYWLYERDDRPRVGVFAQRLADALQELPSAKGIFPEECRSLICEARGDLAGAIKHRLNEIRLIKRLHEISRDSPAREDVFKLYGYDDLSNRLDLLAVLYQENGDLAKAISTLRESAELCRRHKIPFDGDDVLRECLEEMNLVAHDVTNRRPVGANGRKIVLAATSALRKSTK